MKWHLKRRRLLAVVGILGLGMCGFRVWQLSRPLQPIAIGPRTTVIDGPLTDEGYIDYAGYLNERYSRGVTSDTNAVVLILQAVGPGEIPPQLREHYFGLLGIDPLPETGPYLIDHDQFVDRYERTPEERREVVERLLEQLSLASTSPWTAVDYPEVAELIDANAQPLALIIEASRRSGYYSPVIIDPATPALTFAEAPLRQGQRVALGLLTARSMLKLGNADAAGAWDDLLACHRLGRLTARNPLLLTALTSIGFDVSAATCSQSLLVSEHLSVELARQCIADLDALAPPIDIAQIADESMRFEFLDAMQMFAQGRGGMFNEIAGNAFPHPLPNTPARFAKTDWSVVLQLGNESYDSIVNALRIPDPQTRRAELERLRAHWTDVDAFTSVSMNVHHFLGNRETASRELGRILIALFAPSITWADAGEDRAHTHWRFQRLGFALAAYRREHGAYPDSLDALRPDYLSEVPVDPFSIAPFIYQRTESGYRLLSVGENLGEDGHIEPHAYPQGDDIIFEINDP